MCWKEREREGDREGEREGTGREGEGRRVLKYKK